MSRTPGTPAHQDGVDVNSTGIYCRPICPARTPARRNMRFFPHAGAAEAAGFRACRRCRPEASPGSPDWNARADLGTSPIALATTTLLQTARRLLAETDMPVTEIAFASGFASVRQFNASFQEADGRTPTALRARVPRPRRPAEGTGDGPPPAVGMQVRDGPGTRWPGTR